MYPPSRAPGATEKERSRGFKNIVRAVFLALLATFMGIFLTYTLPDLVSGALGRTMAEWFYEM